MYTLGIHHVSINVNDVAEAERFDEVLGLENYRDLILVLPVLT